MPDTQKNLISTRALGKSFPGVKALDNINFTLKAGEVHVLFGENGAGKSTLISLLAGVYPQTTGDLLVNGEKKKFASVREARACGISAVFQEFSLVPSMTVAQNMFMEQQPKRGIFIDKKRMLSETKALFESLGFSIDPQALISTLSRAQQQMVEIAKAFHADVSILILDEPTASLTDKETDQLFSFIREAKSRGVGIIYISHRVQEFSQIADRITVLRDGQYVGTVSADDLNENALLEMMAGRAIKDVYPKIKKSHNSTTTLKVENLSAAGVHNVSLEVKAGEILGIAGLVGSGKSRFWRTLFGLQQTLKGNVQFKGTDVTHANTCDLFESGFFYLPPDRKEEGLQLSAPSSDNIGFSLLSRNDLLNRFGLVHKSNKLREVHTIAKQTGLRETYLRRPAAQLSGGNQQKVLFAKGFGHNFDLYVFDEPTVGVDMGTREALYLLIRDLTEMGKAVVVISSDLPEVINLSHRLIVFSNGRISAELAGNDINQENVLRYFFADTRQTA